MRLGITALTLAACAAWATPASAQDGESPTSAADLGRHLLVASEAKLTEGKTLIAQGRLEEGLRALREISTLLRRHEALLGGAAAAQPSVRPAQPAVGPVVRRGNDTKSSFDAEQSVASALDWLARHQGPDGGWHSKTFTVSAACGCGGAAASDDHTVGVTGLALLAFVGSGNSMRHGKYKDVVKRGALYLKSVQTPDGCLGQKVGNGHYLYGHAAATMALAEVYGVSGTTPSLKASVQQAVNFLLSAQNPYLGWRYGIRPGDNDTSVTAWAVLALKSAKVTGFTVPDHAFAGARKWFDKVTDDAFFKTGYVQRGDNGARMANAQQYQPTEAMTAAALACRRLMGQGADEPVCRGGATLLLNMPPKWAPKSGNDFYYWYFGTLACYQQGGKAWRVWSPRLRHALVRHQRRDGAAAGSWDVESAWGKAGGRVYTTAMNCLSLQIVQRSQKGK